MKRLLLTGAIALAMSGAALSGAVAPAQAAVYFGGGVHVGPPAHWHKVCRWEWRHHQRIQVCSWQKGW